jgi:hypothetical protein
MKSFFDDVTPVAVPVELRFVAVTPLLAASWLKRNRKNRKLKEITVNAVANDMRNGAFVTTHQGIAFNAEGDLIDGQHRLEAVVRSRQTVTLLVSYGWPVDGKFKVMDAVDRGVQRSLADQLRVQHGYEDAGRIVQVVNGVAAGCFGAQRVFKSTTANVLKVLELYGAEIKWVDGFAVKQKGIRLATVAAAMVLAYAVSPKKTADFFARLISGENLSGDNPILPVRNWLLGEGAMEFNVTVRNTVLNHLVAFAANKKVTKVLPATEEGLVFTLQPQRDRVLAVCTEYNKRPPEFLEATAAPAKKRFIAEKDSQAALARLSERFSSLDLRARLDDPEAAGRLLGVWLAQGLVTPAGLKEFTKTEKGKAIA